jgi:N-acetylmuramoyl-L-alanine amidase
MFGRIRWILRALVVLSILVTSCSPPPQEDGYAFLARYQASRQQGAPYKAVVTPVPGTTPAASSTGSSAPRQSSRTVVFLDPGHGGVDTGTIGTTNDGTQIFEKTYTVAGGIKCRHVGETI